MSGRVVHFEIPVDDPARAQDFYRSAFGWQLDSMPEMKYTMVRTTPTTEQGGPVDPGAINGGMLERQPRCPHRSSRSRSRTSTRRWSGSRRWVARPRCRSKP